MPPIGGFFFGGKMAETRLHKKPDSIWLFDYPSLLEMDDCPQWLVLLSERDINIIWQATLNIDRFRSRVFTDVQGLRYTIADLDQWGNFREWVSDMNVNMGDFMACNELLQRIAEALEGMSTMSGCCGGIEGVNGGSGGAGMEEAPSSDVQDTEEAHEGPPPPGYGSWEEFDSDKCSWLSHALGQMRVDVATMGSVQITVTAATGLAAILIPLLVTPVGWVVILQIAVVMIAAAATAGFYGWVSTHLETYNDDYLCALYTGSDVTSSIANFGAMVDEKVAEDSNFNALTGYWATSILKSLASVDSINRAYTKQALVIPEADCSACGSTFTAVLWIPSGQTSNWGTIEVDGNSLTGTSEAGDDCNRLNIRFAIDAGSPSVLAHIDVISTTGATHSSGFDFYRPEGEGALIICPSSDCQNTEGENVYEYALCSNTPFSLFIQWSVP